MLQYMDDFVPKRLEIQGEVTLAARRQHQCLTSPTPTSDATDSLHLLPQCNDQLKIPRLPPSRQ